MTDAGWDFETLLTNGWHDHWSPAGEPGEPVSLAFTYYRSEYTVHSVLGHGATREEAIAEAVAKANAWLVDHPGYQPREPWITA